MINFFKKKPQDASDLLKKALDGVRLDVREGARLYRQADWHELGQTASILSARRVPGSSDRATFVVDRNINYTNVCHTECRFCAFYRHRGHSESFRLTLGDIFKKIEELVRIGGTQVMLQGGLDPELGIDFYETMTRAVKNRFPKVHIHSYSAPEIAHLSKISGLSFKETLKRLKDAGLNSLPGGGAEILVDRVKQRVSPAKLSTQGYLQVHRACHELGMHSTLTMVYGLGETIEERIEHLEVCRQLQDQTQGVLAFIPWNFESDATQLPTPPSTAIEYLKMVAISRIYLDNIPHIQAGCVTEGLKIGPMALSFGADDFGGILMEENVIRATGKPQFCLSVSEARRLIEDLGKKPIQRDTNYHRVYHGVAMGSGTCLTRA